MVEQVADTFSNIKATYKRELKIATINAKAAIKEMTKRIDPVTASKATRRLQRDNARFRAKMVLMRLEMEKMREEIKTLRTTRRKIIKSPSPSESPTRNPSQKPPLGEGMEVDGEETVRASPTPTPLPTPAIRRTEKRAALKSRPPPLSYTARKDPSNPEESLMDKIGSLMEAKLMAFREELFPGRAIRPPLKEISGAERAPPLAFPPSTSGGKEGKKEKGERMGKTSPLSSMEVIRYEIPSTSQLLPSEEGSWSKVVGRRVRRGEGREGRPRHSTCTQDTTDANTDQW